MTSISDYPASVGFCYLDREFRYLDINDCLARINGLTVEQHLGKTIYQVVPDVAHGIVGQLNKVAETRQPIVSGQVVASTPAHPDEERTYEHNFLPDLRTDGTVVGFHIVVRDLSGPDSPDPYMIWHEIVSIGRACMRAGHGALAIEFLAEILDDPVRLQVAVDLGNEVRAINPAFIAEFVTISRMVLESWKLRTLGQQSPLAWYRENSVSGEWGRLQVRARALFRELSEAEEAMTLLELATAKGLIPYLSGIIRLNL